MEATKMDGTTKMTQPTAPHALASLVGATEPVTRNQLQDLASYLEDRLEAIGEHGDCAYERAMGTMYRQALSELQARMAALPECA